MTEGSHPDARMEKDLVCSSGRAAIHHPLPLWCLFLRQRLRKSPVGLELRVPTPLALPHAGTRGVTTTPGPLLDLYVSKYSRP